MSIPTPKTFQLSHNDCVKLRAALQAKADEALHGMDFTRHNAFADAIQLLHETRLDAFQNRADKRREKRALARAENFPARMGGDP